MTLTDEQRQWIAEVDPQVTLYDLALQFMRKFKTDAATTGRLFAEYVRSVF
jgi:hypothetical protein